MMQSQSRATHAVDIRIDGHMIAADVTIPDRCRGLIVFAHGSGSSRFSPRNRAVAGALVRSSFGTVLADLLTEDEADVDARTARPRFDITLLAGRVVNVLDWITSHEELRGLPIGLFGASTGAAAALVAATERPSAVAAIVSRGGRPDLAGPALPLVRAPTLLIVGGFDPEVLDLNREALSRLTCESRLEIVAGATHLFEEPGTLEQVTTLARDWFEKNLGKPGGS